MIGRVQSSVQRSQHIQVAPHSEGRLTETRINQCIINQISSECMSADTDDLTRSSRPTTADKNEHNIQNIMELFKRSPSRIFEVMLCGLHNIYSDGWKPPRNLSSTSQCTPNTPTYLGAEADQMFEIVLHIVVDEVFVVRSKGLRFAAQQKKNCSFVVA